MIKGAEARKERSTRRLSLSLGPRPLTAFDSGLCVSKRTERSDKVERKARVQLKVWETSPMQASRGSGNPPAVENLSSKDWSFQLKGGHWLCHSAERLSVKHQMPWPWKDLPQRTMCAKNTTLISKVIVYPEAKYEEAWPGNSYWGYPKFHVPTWKLFHEAFIVTE